MDAAQAADLSGDDPHFWLDPTKLSQVAAAFEEQLAAADPAHRAAYARNLAGLQSDLATLDRDFRTGLAHCAISTIVVSHDAFGYLGRRYGLEVVGINGLSPDAEPSPAHIRELQDLIRLRPDHHGLLRAARQPEVRRQPGGRPRHPRRGARPRSRA